ncbi:MAG TPA: DsbE family thiol:disulfide interchange protein [Gammaproteobacteria bacterium]|nr:DsbE family thiol:disulfide interchange protein [Gammaproteobacteria bacterium]
MKALFFLLPVGIVVLLLLLFWKGLYLNPAQVPSPLIGKPVPDFNLPGVGGTSASLKSADFEGHVSILNVWATWCIPCREEQPELVKLAQQHVVTLYGLNYKDDADSALQWLQTQGNPYERDGYDPKGQVGLNFGVYGVPETFVVDSHGIIRHKYIGPLTASLVNGQLIPLVHELEQGSK